MAFTELVRSTRAVFMTGKTQAFEWRRQQLLAVIRMMEEEREAIVSALNKDLRKPEAETMVMEVEFVRNDAVYVLDHLQEWMKPQKAGKNILTMMDDAYIKYEPFGVVLVLGAWNYPLQLTLGPVVGAIAAGNCVVLKPSEVSQNTAKLLEALFSKYMDKDCLRVVNGGVPETTDLLKEKFDYIMYTGNNQVARIVYEAAAKHLTPVTLELGGKSPVYVDDTCDLDLVSRRLMWGKFTNAGQTCIAPDYVLCSKSVQGELVDKCRATLKQFYGENPAESDSFGRIVNSRHTSGTVFRYIVSRVKALMEGSGHIAVGGSIDEKTCYIEPTILIDVKPSDPIMKDEIFGPVLPILNVNNVDEALDIINSKDKPLALYVFSKNKAVVDRLLNGTSSGGVTVNDTLMHPSLPTLPFGGVGSSGMGAYHGKFSFDTFSHKRAVLRRPQSMEMLNDVRYPPFTAKKLAIMGYALRNNPRGRFTRLWSYLPVLIFGVLLGILLKKPGSERKGGKGKDRNTWRECSTKI